MNTGQKNAFQKRARPPLTALLALFLLAFFLPALSPGALPGTEAKAASMTRGVGRSGAPAPPSSAPSSSYGRSPRDFSRGYEGAAPGDPWNRESDFKSRSYQFRHGPEPSHAEPPFLHYAPSIAHPPRAGGTGADQGPESTLPKPPLPLDRDMPGDSPDVPQRR